MGVSGSMGLTINLVSMILQATTDSKSSWLSECFGNLSDLLELVSSMVLTWIDLLIWSKLELIYIYQSKVWFVFLKLA